MSIPQEYQKQKESGENYIIRIYFLVRNTSRFNSILECSSKKWSLSTIYIGRQLRLHKIFLTKNIHTLAKAVLLFLIFVVLLAVVLLLRCKHQDSQSHSLPLLAAQSLVHIFVHARSLASLFPYSNNTQSAQTKNTLGLELDEGEIYRFFFPSAVPLHINW